MLINHVIVYYTETNQFKNLIQSDFTKLVQCKDFSVDTQIEESNQV